MDGWMEDFCGGAWRDSSNITTASGRYCDEAVTARELARDTDHIRYLISLQLSWSCIVHGDNNYRNLGSHIDLHIPTPAAHFDNPVTAWRLTFFPHGSVAYIPSDCRASTVCVPSLMLIAQVVFWSADTHRHTDTQTESQTWLITPPTCRLYRRRR